MQYRATSFLSLKYDLGKNEHNLETSRISLHDYFGASRDVIGV